MENINTWVGDGLIVELFKSETAFVVRVFGRSGGLAAEIRVSDADSVAPLVTSILAGAGLREMGE